MDGKPDNVKAIIQVPVSPLFAVKQALVLLLLLRISKT